MLHLYGVNMMALFEYEAEVTVNGSLVLALTFCFDFASSLSTFLSLISLFFIQDRSFIALHTVLMLPQHKFCFKTVDVTMPHVLKS